jgi:hypothetical protein
MGLLLPVYFGHFVLQQLDLNDERLRQRGRGGRECVNLRLSRLKIFNEKIANLNAVDKNVYLGLFLKYFLARSKKKQFKVLSVD